MSLVGDYPVAFGGFESLSPDSSHSYILPLRHYRPVLPFALAHFSYFHLSTHTPITDPLPLLTPPTGDAPLRFATMAMFFDPSQVLWMNDFTYYHIWTFEEEKRDKERRGEMILAGQ